MTVPGVPREPFPSRPLPNGWRWVKLGEVVWEARAGFACGLRDPQGIVQLRMNNVDTRGNVVWDDVLRVPRDAADMERYTLAGGDVLFNNTNSTALVGKSALFAEYGEPVVYSNHFTRLRTAPELLVPEFLASWLNHQWFQGVFAAICNAWIGQSAVKGDKLLGLSLPLPPLSEQRRIAAVLREQMAAVERARVAAITRLEAVKTLPATFLREVFPNPGQDLPDGWRWVRLGEMAKTTSGSTPSRSQPMYYGGDIPWVKTGELRDGYVERTDENITRQALAECSLSLLPPGTLLVAMYGQGQTRGRTGLLSIHATTNQACFAILPNEQEFIPLYLQAWFWQSYDRIREETEGRGGNQPNLNGQILKQMVVPLPTLVEQGQIAARLRDQMATIEKARAAAEAELHTINVLPAALLRRAFTGEI